MDPVPVRCLLNSISRYLHLVACQTIRFNPIQTCIGNMVLLLKLLKPLLDEVVDCKIPSDDCLYKGCEDLDSVVNQAREFLEDWSPKLSKLFGVFQCEVLLGKVQTCSLEISRILLQLSQSSPVTSSVQSVERCVQETESFKQEGTLMELMENALRNQKDDITSLDNNHLESIIQMLGLISNQDLLKESITVEKERIRSQASKSEEDMEQTEQLIELVLCIREHMLKTEFLEVAKGISIPPYFRCPLSTELMLDPVIVASGQTFDRTSIKKWLDNGLAVCPRTRQVLTHQELIPNYTVKAMIASWLEANRINLATNSCHQYDGGDASSMANNMGSQDFNRTESFRFSLRSSSLTSRSSLETGNGFEKLKINVSASLCGESQSKDLEIFELLSPGQSYTHSRSESVCSVVSSVDYVPSVTHETESILGNHQSSSEMSPKKNLESSNNVNHEHSAAKTYECSVHDLDDSGTMTTSHTIKLVEDLKSGSNKVKTAAAAEIRHLTINSIENRVHIGRCGAITPLLSLLYSEEKLTQEHAVTALLNLSISELNKAMIVEVGAIEPLVHVLNTGNDRAKENSAASLFSLSVLQVNRERIGQSNAAIQALVNLLGKGTFRGKKDAASALFNLSITHDNKARIVQAKAVKYLVELLDPDLEMVDKAVALLANLSAVGEGRQAIVREGGIPLLVETVDLGSQRGKENAASVLLQLCLNSPKFCTLVLQEGAIPPLVALSQSGTQRAKEKAQQLLSHFRNQRDARMKKVSGQNDIPDWVRDHRVHHKFSETDADPHNANRGFFFSHVGWLMQRKHPEVYRRGKTIDMSDIDNDPLVQFHTKHFLLFKMLLCFIIPVLVAVYVLNENWVEAISSLAVVRYVLNLNFTWSVNSVAHIWGSKPYDKRIQPAQNLMVSIVAMGEGWHNYHHVFPWDYRAAEIGGYLLNTTTLWLDLFASIGWAYDLKTPSKQLVQQVAVNHGDGSWREEPETAHTRDYKTS